MNLKTSTSPKREVTHSIYRESFKSVTECSKSITVQYYPQHTYQFETISTSWEAYNQAAT